MCQSVLHLLVQLHAVGERRTSCVCVCVCVCVSVCSVCNVHSTCMCVHVQVCVCQ